MSGECGSGWESEAIRYTFKNMQLLGYEVKLYKRTKKKGSEDLIEEDLSKLFVRPCKEVKKEMKRNKKRAKEGEDSEDDENEDEEKKPVGKGGSDEVAKGPQATPQVIGNEEISAIIPPLEEKK